MRRCNICAPCVIIINGCGIGNNAANSFVNANEQFAEAIQYLADNGTLSAADSGLVIAHCDGYQAIADEIDVFTTKTIALAAAIAKRSKNPHP